jgi:hypothetical protein
MIWRGFLPNVNVFSVARPRIRVGTMFRYNNKDTVYGGEIDII